MMRRTCSVGAWIPPVLLAICLIPSLMKAASPKTAAKNAATIDVDTNRITGKVSPYVFGQNIEHEHGTISGGEQNQDDAHGMHSGGLWAEMLRDRKFEEGDNDGTAWPTPGCPRS